MGFRGWEFRMCSLTLSSNSEPRAIARKNSDSQHNVRPEVTKCTIVATEEQIGTAKFGFWVYG